MAPLAGHWRVVYWSMTGLEFALTMLGCALALTGGILGAWGVVKDREDLSRLIAGAPAAASVSGTDPKEGRVNGAARQLEDQAHFKAWMIARLQGGMRPGAFNAVLVICGTIINVVVAVLAFESH